MSNRNILQALQSAGGAGGAPLDVDDVFSTHLYTGNNSTQTITNGIDLSGEGGLVWTRSRSVGDNHRLTDTERGVNKGLDSSNTYAEFTATGANGVSQFNNNGFISDMSSSFFNNQSIVAWTFRKAPKFFDILTWTGNGVNGRVFNHSLDSKLGMITIKCTSDASTNWATWHRGSSSAALWLNSTNANSVNGGGQTASGFVYNPSTSTTSFSVDNGANVNQSGRTYVAYLWAHNDDDGEFGPSSDQDIIKCGSYESQGTSVQQEVNLGFEPQFVLIKAIDKTDHWYMLDSMRGIATQKDAPNDQYLFANGGSAEATAGVIDLTSTGFKTTAYGNANSNGYNYAYMAIRRGPLAVPEDATKVFNVATYSSNSNSNLYNTGFDVDMTINTTTISNSNYVLSRLTNKYLDTNSTASDNTLPSTVFNSESNVINLNTGWWGTTNTVVSWMWKRAPGYFDVVCYAGSTTTPRTISHNLTVIPEMIWLKGRDAGGGQWYVYHKDTGNQAYGALNENYYIYTASDGVVAQTIWNATNPTASVFSLGNASNGNSNGQNFIAYLFATAPGVSKVGSFTGSTSDVTVDCGFSSGAKFVMVKDASANGDWYVWDSVRGIVAGNDGYLELNTTDAENTGGDYIDPHSSGFIITSGFMQSGRTYIFYAIA